MILPELSMLSDSHMKDTEKWEQSRATHESIHLVDGEFWHISRFAALYCNRANVNHVLDDCIISNIYCLGPSLVLGGDDFQFSMLNTN